MTDTNSTTPPAGAAVAVAPPQRELNLTWALVLISIAQLMVVLDATIANIALPYIQTDLGISNANLPWIVTGYALAFGSLLLLGGRLGDLYGRRRVFMAGLVIFAIASLLGGLAQSETLLLGARGLQGLGAALASPAALALITTTFPAGPARNRAFAVYAAMSGAGAAVGLILGGWLTGTSPEIFGVVIDGWRLTFLINVPIGIVAALLAPRFLNESESHPGELDLPGAVTGTLGLLGIVYGLSRAGTQGWSDSLTIASLAVGAVLMVVFIVIESRVEHPLLPFRVFMNRTRASSFVAMFFAPAAMFAMFYFLSQYIQNVMGYSPLKAGVAFLPFTRRHRRRGGPGLQPGRPDQPEVHRRRRHTDGVRRPVRVLDAALRHGVPGERRDRRLRHRHPAVHPPDGGRHGSHLRADHPDRGPPPAQRGLRHRLRRAQHHAAGRRRPRARRAGHGGDADVHRPRCRAGQGGRRPQPRRAARRRPRARCRRCRRSSSTRSSPRAPPRRSWSGAS